MPTFESPVISYGALGAFGHNISQEYGLADYAVLADALIGCAVLGTSNTGFGAVGITGFVPRDILSGEIAGVCGAASVTTGVRGKSISYFGVHGQSSNAAGVLGESVNSTGVYGKGALIGVEGRSAGSFGVLGTSDTSVGVCAKSLQGSGVFGQSNTGAGVYGQSAAGTGVHGRSSTGWAGVFEGNVLVTGTIVKGAMGFKIDHPLDPKNKYLNHSGVESPDMKNMYDGIAELDAKGQAVVKLPAWFEALNKDFRYQLTPLGDLSPDLHIAKEIEGNRFVIGGGKPRIRVCWQVTGIRQDAFANANRLPVEENKPAKERGLFLHPESFKQSEKKRIPLGGEPEAFDKAEKEFAQIRKELAKQPKLPELPEPKSQSKPKKGSR
jgi:hypothetical protein